MPDGIHGGGRPGRGSPGGGLPRVPERRRRFPRFFFFPIYYGQPSPRCDYIDSFGRCCDIYGRCCDSYGRCDYGYYSGGYPSAGADTGGMDMTQDYGRSDYDRNY